MKTRCEGDGSGKVDFWSDGAWLPAYGLLVHTLPGEEAVRTNDIFPLFGVV